MTGRFQFPEDVVEDTRVPMLSKSSPLLFALSFGAIIIAVTLIVTPMISDRVLALTNSSAGLTPDRVVTGAIPKEEPLKRYTIRRSIMQQSPNDVCIIPFGSNVVKC